MLSMNGIIALELILGVILTSLIFTSLGDTDLIANSSSKTKPSPESDGVRVMNNPNCADRSSEAKAEFL